MTLQLPVQMLGQSGCKLAFPGATVYVDPYLSNSVQELDAADLQRQVAITLSPQDVRDADWVLITHKHIDHCDPHTLPKLAQASPQAKFVGPAPVLAELATWGIATSRLVLAIEDWSQLGPDLRVKAVPAAHPEIERDGEGNLACVGFLLDYQGKRIYLAGDTSARQEVMDDLIANGPIHAAFLPVNEPNFFRKRRGIIGNMSVREAFQFAEEVGIKQVVAVHWDMFAANAVDPDEIRLIHGKLKPDFSLLIRPTHLSFGTTRVSIIIRTLNEARHLDDVLRQISSQKTDGLHHEVLLVDSGSTDGTLEIAKRHGCRIHHISRDEFSFGRSLNTGCHAAVGDILVFVSGHCVPTDEHWLQRLCQPILDGLAEYSYGRQLGGPDTYFSESRIFAKYYPAQSSIPQEGFFCNNANAALSRTTWEQHRFNEELTGLEDMDLAQRLAGAGGRIAYVAESAVFHHHNESWPQIRRRFEREAIALQGIMPQVHVDLFDTLRYFVASVSKDWRTARRESGTRSRLVDMVRYRWNQYLGSWKGNRQHRMLSHAEKERFFFPF